MSSHVGTTRDPILVTLVGGLAMFAVAIGFVACTSGTTQNGGVETTTTTTAVKVAPTTAVSFSSCAKAAGAGYHDMRRGAPGYSSTLDADGDGVACDTTAPTTPKTMTFAECQKSAEYPGGKYAVEYDNGVCTVQKP